MLIEIDSLISFQDHLKRIEQKVDRIGQMIVDLAMTGRHIVAPEREPSPELVE